VTEGRLQGNQITAFFQKCVRGKGMPEIVEPKALYSKVFQKVSSSFIDVYKRRTSAPFPKSPINREKPFSDNYFRNFFQLLYFDKNP